MVKTYMQFWFTIPSSKEDVYDKIYKWFEGQKKPKFKKSTERPHLLFVIQGSGMASLYKPEIKKEMIINLYDDELMLKEWGCDEKCKTVLKIQVYPSTAGSMTKAMHLKARQIYADSYFKELFDLLGGTPMQVRIKGSKITVTADGSFGQDYTFDWKSRSIIIWIKLFIELIFLNFLFL